MGILDSELDRLRKRVSDLEWYEGEHKRKQAQLDSIAKLAFDFVDRPIGGSAVRVVNAIYQHAIYKAEPAPEGQPNDG